MSPVYVVTEPAKAASRSPAVPESGPELISKVISPKVAALIATNSDKVGWSSIATPTSPSCVVAVVKRG